MERKFKGHLLKKALSFSLVLMMITMVQFPIVYALIDLSAPYSGDDLVVVNTNEDVFASSLSSQNTGVMPNVLDGEMPNFSTDGETETDIMGYDENGVGMIDPNSFIEDFDLPLPSNDDNEGSYSQYLVQSSYELNQVKSLTVKTGSSSYTSREFKMVATGTNNTVWTPTDTALYPISVEDAQKISAEFDRVYGDMVNYFGTPNPTPKNFSDPDNDGKVAIICYDIDMNGNSGGSYIGGYFHPLDLYTKAQVSTAFDNAMDMIHIDSVQGMSMTSSGNRTIENSYDTMVHEFQHLIMNVNAPYTNVPTFINEAFSEASTHLIYGDNNVRVNGFNGSSDIRNGNASLTYWNYSNALPNYYLSYLFGMYIPTQYESGNTIFAEAIRRFANISLGTTESEMYQCLDIIVDITNAGSRADLIKNFYTALVVKDSSGKYAFNDENWAVKVNAQIYTGSTATLLPGSAVYKGAHENFTPSGYGSDIKFLSYDEVSDITGSIKGYRGDLTTTVELFYTSDTTRSNPVYKTTLEPQNKAGQTNSDFIIKNVKSGVYDMVITRDGALAIELHDITKTDDHLDLTSSQNNNISTLILLSGDLNGDGKINFADVAIIRNSKNYNKSTTNSSALGIADINGDSIVNYHDLQILTSEENYNKITIIH